MNTFVIKEIKGRESGRGRGKKSVRTGIKVVEELSYPKYSRWYQHNTVDTEPRYS